MSLKSWNGLATPTGAIDPAGRLVPNSLAPEIIVPSPGVTYSAPSGITGTSGMNGSDDSPGIASDWAPLAWQTAGSYSYTPATSDNFSNAPATNNPTIAADKGAPADS